MRILVFGDSNSWGYRPDGSELRFGEDIRWPMILGAEIGADIREHCLPGRTTAHDDPELLGGEYAHIFNGMRDFPVALKTASPVDLVLIMLGTNDFKLRFQSSAKEIAENLARLVGMARVLGGGANGWKDDTPPKIGVILPPTLTEDVNNPDWERAPEWAGALEKSATLAPACRDVLDVPIFETGVVETGAPDDPIHLTDAAQKALGQRIAQWVRSEFM